MKKVLCVLMLMMSAQAYAADGGCGLGSMIITKNSKLLQLFAATTNQTTLSQPLGITSGTSNCSASGIVMNEREVQYFVEVNQEDLSREMAQGHGEKLFTLAQMKGCVNEGSQKAFGAFTQQNYSKIMTSANASASDVISNLNAQMSAQKDLTQLCHGS